MTPGPEGNPRDEGLRPSEEDFRRLVEYAPDAVLLFDASDTCTDVNALACDLFRYPREELLGLTLADLVGPGEVPRLPRLREDLRCGRTHREEWDLRRKDGGRARGELSAGALSGGRWIAFVRDVVGLSHLERLLADNLPAGFIYQLLQAPDGTVGFTHLSGGVEALCGVTPAEATADPALLYRLVVPEDLPRLRAREEEAFRGRTPFDCQFRTRPRGSAEVRWLHCRSAPRPLPGGGAMWDGIAVDVTDRVRAEAALRDSERLLAQSQRAARVGSWELQLEDLDDVNANPLRWSDEAYRIFGYEPGRVVVTNDLFFHAVHPDDRAAIAAAVAESLRGGDTYEIEHRIVRPDGTHRVVQQWAHIERDAEGRPLRMLGTCQDVTERRAAEEALREADRRKDEFLAMLGHELRNPLAPIRNGLAVLRHRGGADPTVARVLTLMERQVAHAARLIDDLLDVSRVTRGVIELRREPVILADVVTRALEEARPDLEERRHRLELVVAPEPLVLSADPARVQQIVTNLLTNAAKYTPPGGRVSLRVGREGGEAVVRVRDDGIGIRPEMRARIFELFTQADRVEGRVSEGLGLGLPLVKRLVQLHGGSVEVHSDGPGLGSEFVVRLPLARGPVGVPHALPGLGGPAARPRRVLVVDDNRDGADSLAMLLRLGGHDVCVANDGPGAVTAAASFAPEVVLLDIGMPGMNGYEVARRIRLLPGSGRVLLVAVTGYGQEEDRRRSRAAGFDHHLVKPVEFDALARLLGSEAAIAQERGSATRG
jgi:two-component system CheB/CheR fusion protein